jgi:hypothetical protein
MQGTRDMGIARSGWRAEPPNYDHGTRETSRPIMEDFRSAPDEPHRSGDRRPYERPRILFREPLEAMAAVCAPAPPAKGNPGTCPSGPISS